MIYVAKTKQKAGFLMTRLICLPSMLNRPGQSHCHLYTDLLIQTLTRPSIQLLSLQRSLY